MPPFLCPKIVLYGTLNFNLNFISTLYFQTPNKTYY